MYLQYYSVQYVYIHLKAIFCVIPSFVYYVARLRVYLFVPSLIHRSRRSMDGLPDNLELETGTSTQSS